MHIRRWLASVCAVAVGWMVSGCGMGEGGIYIGAPPAERSAAQSIGLENSIPGGLNAFMLPSGNMNVSGFPSNLTIPPNVAPTLPTTPPTPGG